MAEFKLGRLKFVWKGDWATATTYVKDDIVKRGGQSYVITSGHTSTTFPADSVHYEVMTNGIEWKGNYVNGTRYKVGEVVKNSGKSYICKTEYTADAPKLVTEISNWDVLIDATDFKDIWTLSTLYGPGDLVRVNGRLYKCTTAHTSGANFDPTNWVIYSDGFAWKGQFELSTRYELNDVVSFGGSTYICIAAQSRADHFYEADWETFAEGFQWEDSWDDTTEYQIGDMVTYGGYAYVALLRNTNKIPSGEISTWKAAVKGFNNLGEYNTAYSYIPGDCVIWGGNTYECILPTTSGAGQNPENPSSAWTGSGAPQDWWALFMSGIKFVGDWIDVTQYKVGEVVKFSTNSYVCHLTHTSTDGVNDPITDNTHIYWNSIADGSPVSVITTRGDLLFRDVSGPARLPAGSAGYILAMNAGGTEPEWQTTGQVVDGGVNITTGDITTNAGIIGTNLGNLYSNEGNLELTLGNIVVAGDVATGAEGNIDASGNLTIGGDLVLDNSNPAGSLGNITAHGKLVLDSTGASSGAIYVGLDAELSTSEGPTFTDVMAVLRKDADSFIQMALQNTSSSTTSSTDMIVYADNGTNDSGWMDMGITSSTFADASYGITGINDGYIFMSAPEGTTGNGNLYISTNNTGLQNDIIFSTNGFGAVTSEKMRLIGAAHDGMDPGLLIDVIVSTELALAVDAIVTTIKCVDVTAFPTSGSIIIDTEEIGYIGISTSGGFGWFEGCTRGFNSTTANDHLLGTIIKSTAASTSPTTGALRVVGGIGLTGALNAEGDIVAAGGAIYQGRDGGVTAKELILDDRLFSGYAGLTDCSGIFTGDADSFVQFALKNHNSGSGASTDIIAYSSNGDNNSGWIDMGITSENYDDPAFTVTGANTGYLFYASPDLNIEVELETAVDTTDTTFTVSDTTGLPTSGSVQIGNEQASYTGKTATIVNSINGGINDSVTSITISDASTWPTSGTVALGDEEITYSGKTGNLLTGVVRGVNGTTAVLHLNGDTCSLYGTLTGIVRAVNGTRAHSHTPTTHIRTMSTASYTGDLLIGTGAGGNHNDIVIFSNGFDGGNERVRVIGVSRAGHSEGVEILANEDSTSATTGALRVLGGIGLQGNLNVGGNVAIVGTISVGGAGSSLSTTSLAVSDPMIGLGKGNVGDTIDLGIYGQTTSANSITALDMNISVTNITVPATAAFTATGTVMLEDEEITYTSKVDSVTTALVGNINTSAVKLTVAALGSTLQATGTLLIESEQLAYTSKINGVSTTLIAASDNTQVYLDVTSSTSFEVTGTILVQSEQVSYASKSDSSVTSTDGAVTINTPTIAVVDTTAFPSVGTVLIDTEQIQYTGKTSTTLTGCTRGANGTTAATHLTGQTVTVYAQLAGCTRGANGTTAATHIATSTVTSYAVLNGITRAINGTTAATHANGITVIQYGKLLGCTRAVNSTTGVEHLAGTSLRQVAYCGLVRDATDGKFYLFKNLGGNKPTATINQVDPTISMASLVAGTLNLTAVTASSSYSTGALTVGGGLGVTGALYTNSTGNFAGSVTSAGIISSAAIGVNNSAGLTTTQTSINIFNNDATTINFGGLATSGNFGYSSTGSSTTNISTGVVGASFTKAVNIGTGSAASSTTAVNIGSTLGSSITTINQAAVVGTTLAVNGGVASSSYTTGTLLVTGGVGVSGAMFVNGNLTSYGNVVAWYASDKRLKTNIVPISGAMDKISQIGGYSFDWNAEGRAQDPQAQLHEVGVIAQEIQAVLPEVVVERTNGYLAVNYEKIIPLLIQGMKELQAEINTLKAKLGE